MNKLLAGMVLLLALLAPMAVAADVISQTTGPTGTVSTTIQSPTSITTIKTQPGKSVTAKMADGQKFEMDSDGSVYQLFPDGARTAALDGQHTMLNGQVITVKNGKRIP